VFGGDVPPTTANTESWNGSAWTEVNDLNTGRANIAGSGLQTAALAFGGSPGRKANTEDWNGVSWSENADLSTARYDTTAVQQGGATNNLAIGGNAAPAQTSATEEWSSTSNTTKSIDTD